MYNYLKSNILLIRNITYLPGCQVNVISESKKYYPHWNGLHFSLHHTPKKYSTDI